MLDEWKRKCYSTIYKNKRAIQSCTNYCEIKLMLHYETMERIMEQRLRQETQISENQFGFMSERSIMKDIFSLRKLMKKYRDEEKSS